jgi:hypothetical protein
VKWFLVEQTFEQIDLVDRFIADPSEKPPRIVFVGLSMMKTSATRRICVPCGRHIRCKTREVALSDDRLSQSIANCTLSGKNWFAISTALGCPDSKLSAPSRELIE